LTQTTQTTLLLKIHLLICDAVPDESI
jgi:hypothetical protein